MFNRGCRRCCCMNNENNNCNEDLMENKCQNVVSYPTSNNMNGCDCGFDEEEVSVFPKNPMLAQSYVPIQYMDQTFKPCVGLKMGTIFPELVSPYMPCQSMQEDEFIRATNTIGEGCNNVR